MKPSIRAEFSKAAVRTARVGVLSLIAAFSVADTLAVRDATMEHVNKGPAPVSEILPLQSRHTSGSPANELIKKVAELVASTREGKDVHLKVAEHAQVERSGVRGGNRTLSPPKLG